MEKMFSVILLISSIGFAGDPVPLPPPIPPRKEFIGQKIHYVKDADLYRYKVQIRDGLLCDFEGKPLNSYRSPLPSIYIIDENGDLYVSLYQEHGKFHHSTLAQGKAVIMAGDVYIQEGRIITIDNRSGHYMPGADRIEFLKKYLEERGVDMSQVLAYPEAATIYLSKHCETRLKRRLFLN